MVARPPEYVADLDERILDMSGDDVDVVFIERDELEFVRARTHPLQSLIDPLLAKLVTTPPPRKWRSHVLLVLYLHPFGVAALPGGQSLPE
jgi:hypothetical protein